MDMRLAAFMKASRQDILIQWDQFAASLSGGSDMNRTELRDHAEQVLLAIADDLDMTDDEAEESRKHRLHMAPNTTRTVRTAFERHATERLHGGFSLTEMVSEYRALRVSVLQLWGETLTELKRSEFDDTTRFNEAIDQAIAEAVLRYDTDISESRWMFLGTLAYDLRNPLSAIGTWAQFMMQAKALEAPYLKAAAGINASSSRLEHIVANLVDFARIQLKAGIKPENVPIDFGAICQQAVATLHASNPTCEIRFTSNGDLQGVGDGGRINRAYANLIENVLEYCSPDKPVSVSIDARGDTIITRIHVPGIMIPPAKIPTIFEVIRHEEAGKARDASEPRLELGLYISHEIVIAHDGDIGVTSNEEEGTTFTVEIPRSPKISTGPQLSPGLPAGPWTPPISAPPFVGSPEPPD